MNARAVVVGLATLDYVLTTERPIAGPGTVLANALTREDWPRAGGAAIYAARRIRAAGHATWPIVSIGDDATGAAYRTACREADVAPEGIVEVEGGKTPCCFLIYHDDGRYTCLLDLGTASTPTLSIGQTKLIVTADLVVMAAADARLIADVLDHVAEDQLVAWIVKDDPACFPATLCETLTRRADVIFCNTSELHLVEPYLDGAKPGLVMFETLGAEGVRVRQDGSDICIETVPIDVDDATGAGDTFAGEVLAQILIGGVGPALAAERGVLQVQDMLQARLAVPAVKGDRQLSQKVDAI